MRDFTLRSYTYLIDTLLQYNYSFLLVSKSENISALKSIVLRHDVDSLPWNSLKFAEIQAKKGIKGTYYFRIVPKSFDKRIIKEVYSLGHEIGYHYEDVSISAQSKISSLLKKGLEAEINLAEIAYDSFKLNLEKIRQIAPVNTICMHGSPLSRWDSRILWKYYNYHDLGIEVEPYFDIDFEKILYLTDTGRRWDGSNVSIRDKGLIKKTTPSSDSYSEWKIKPIAGSLMDMKQKSINFQKKFAMRSTFEIIKNAEREKLQNKIMMTFHPQRWNDQTGPWAKELIWQNVKNLGKYFFVKLRS